MATSLEIVAALSSIALRILVYIFLRWIPGHPFPPAIYAVALTYYASLYLDRRKDGHNDPPRGSDGQTARPTTGTKKRQETEHIQKQPWHLNSRTWLLGLPSPTYSWNWLAVSVNAILIVLTLDLVYSAPLLYPSDDLSFARLGYISPNTASILVREPDPTKYPIYLTYRMLEPPGTWRRAGFIPRLYESTDFTAPLKIEHLEPETMYAYTLSNNHTGVFTTAPPIGLAPVIETDKKEIKHTLTFLTSSCLKPQVPYNPLRHRLHIPGLAHLSSLLPPLDPSFILFLGDFIYADVPRLRNPLPSTSYYRSEYRRVYASPSWPRVNTIPWLHVWDDHEIANDWDSGTTAPYPSARDPFNHYHHSVNPPTTNKNETWYTFHHGPASFFLLDTRTYRSPSLPLPATDPAKTILGKQQLASLLRWLHEPEPTGVRFKILVSSVPFTRNWRVNAQDTWSGYLHERLTILQAMWSVPRFSPGTGVIILSGDRHEFAATRFPVPEQQEEEGKADVIEFSTSPLSMFYLPFRTYKQDDRDADVSARWGWDEQVKYIPDGNSKVGAVEIDEEGDISRPGRLRFRLFIDGVEVWGHEVLSPVVEDADDDDEVEEEGEQGYWVGDIEL